MPDSEVSVKFSTKSEADLWRAFVKLGQEAAKAGDAGANAAAGISKIDPAIRRFASSAKQIISTPLEKFQANVEKLDKAMAAGMVTADQYARIKEKFSGEMKVSSQPIKEVTEEEKRAASEAAKAAAEAEKFAESVKKITATPLDRLNEKMERLRASYKAGFLSDKQFQGAHQSFQLDYAKEAMAGIPRAGALLREENQKTISSNKAVGASATLTWSSVVTAVSTASQTIGSVATAAFRRVYDILREVRQEADQAARHMGETLKSQGTLAQLGATPEENAKLTKIADAAYATGTVETRQQGAEFTKSLSNANKLNEVQLFGRMQRTGVVSDAGQFAGMINTIQTSMGAEAGTSQELASMAFQAGTKSYDDVNSLIKGAAKAGSAAKGAGKTTPELLAGTAIMSQALGGSDLGGERMKAFMEAIERNKSLQGKNLVETLELIKKKTGGRTDRMLKMLGSTEAMNAAQVLGDNTESLAAQIADIEKARQEDYASQKMAYLESQPERRAEVFRRKQAATAELEKEKTLGAPAALAQAAIDKEASLARVGKTEGFQSSFAKSAMGSFNMPTEGGLAGELTGMLARATGQIQRTILGDQQFIGARAQGLPAGSQEQGAIYDAINFSDQNLKGLVSGNFRAEADRTMGINADVTGRPRTPDAVEGVGGTQAVGGTTRIVENVKQQDEAAAKQMEAATSFSQAVNMLIGAIQGRPTTASPVFSSDVSRRAQQQHAVPAE